MKLSKLRVPELRKYLKARGLDEKGNRPVLIKRLREALEREQNAKPVEDKQNDLENQDGKELPAIVEVHADSSSQQPNLDGNSLRRSRSKTERAYKRKLEDEIDPDDRSPKRQYKTNGNGGNDPLSTNVTRNNSSPPRRQCRSETLGEETAVDDKARPGRTPVQEQPLKPVELGVMDCSNHEADEHGVNSLDKDSKDATALAGQPHKNESPSKGLETSEPKSAENMLKADDVASLERIRRRKERFGIVIKEAAGSDPTDEEAVRKRRARFGVIAVMNNSAKVSQTAQQEHDEAALRRRAEKFGLNVEKHVPIGTEIPKDEAEKRLRRRKRFQSVS
ncbi:SAP domain containing protein [Gracilaria domingensis]|nr:SAP domain containing protein [Gracilaria domingensis]